MEGSSSVSDAALFPRPQLFELHLTAQVPEGRFEHFPQVSVGLQRLGYERLGPHLQDGLAEALRAAHQVPVRRKIKKTTSGLGFGVRQRA